MEREGKDYVKEKQEIREFFYRYGKAIDAHDWGYVLNQLKKVKGSNCG